MLGRLLDAILQTLESYVDWKAIPWIRKRVPRAQRTATRIRQLEEQAATEQDQRAEAVATISAEVKKMEGVIRGVRKQVANLQAQLDEYAERASRAQNLAAQAEARGDQEEASRQRMVEESETLFVEGLAVSLGTAEETLADAENRLKEANVSELQAHKNIRLAEVQRLRDRVSGQGEIVRAASLDIQESMQQAQRALLDLTGTASSSEAGRAAIKKELDEDEAKIHGRGKVYQTLAEARGQNLAQGLTSSTTARSRELAQRALQRAGYQKVQPASSGEQNSTGTKKLSANK